MGLFGGGGGSAKSKTTRPDYINNMVNSLSKQINNASVGDYTNMNYAGLDQNTIDALQKQLANPEMQGYADQLMASGEEGINSLNDVYNRYTNALNQGISASDLEKMTSELYNRGDVENAINASNQKSERQFSTETAPNAAMQANLSGGFGSAQRLGQSRAQEALVNEEQANADTIANTAYTNAQNQAQSILATNQQTKMAGLGALTQNAMNQASNVNTAAGMNQDMYNQSMNANTQLLSNEQNRLNNQYMNATNAANWNLQNTQNKINAAGVLNGVLGTTTTTKTSGGGSGILGGAMSGAAAGSAFGPWGALAGAVIGGVASS